MAVTSRRLRTCAVHTWYPHRFVTILDEGLATGTFNNIGEDEELFNHLKTLGGPFWKKCRSEHPFSTNTQQMFSIARASDWKPSETLMKKINQQ